MDSKVCSLGSEEALVSAPWAPALLWIITLLSGAASCHGGMCMCACLFGCDRMSWGGGITGTQKKAININVVL